MVDDPQHRPAGDRVGVVEGAVRRARDLVHLVPGGRPRSATRRSSRPPPRAGRTSRRTSRRSSRHLRPAHRCPPPRPATDAPQYGDRVRDGRRPSSRLGACEPSATPGPGSSPSSVPGRTRSAPTTAWWSGSRRPACAASTGTAGSATTRIALPHVPGPRARRPVAEVGPTVHAWSVGDRVTVPFVCGCGRCEHCLRRRRPGLPGPDPARLHRTGLVRRAGRRPRTPTSTWSGCPTRSTS